MIFVQLTIAARSGKKVALKRPLLHPNEQRWFETSSIFRMVMAHTCEGDTGRRVVCEIDELPWDFSIFFSIYCVVEMQVGCGNTSRLGTCIRRAKWEYNVNMDSECVYAIWTHFNFHIHKFAMPSWGLKLHSRSDASSGVVFGNGRQTDNQLDGYTSSASAV